MKGVSQEEKKGTIQTHRIHHDPQAGVLQLLPFDGSPRAEGVSGRHEIVHGICFPSSQNRRDLHRLSRGIKKRPHYKSIGTTLLAFLPLNSHIIQLDPHYLTV
jgi:hypothetical protein